MLKHSFAYALVAVLAIWAAQERKAQPNQTNAQPQPQNTNAQPVSTPIQNPLPQIDNAAEAERERQQQQRDAKEQSLKADQLAQNQIIADATFWMAIFAGLNLLVAIAYAIFAALTLQAIKTQSRHAGEQVKAAEAQLKVMDRSLVIGTRAYVVAKVRDIGERDNTLQFRLRIQNGGNTPANNVCVSYICGVELPWAKPGLKSDTLEEKKTNMGMKYLDHIEQLGVVGPRGSYHVIETPENPMNPWQLEEWDAGELKFFCWGRIDYTDIFNETRHTTFCFFQSQTHPYGYPCECGNEAE